MTAIGCVDDGRSSIARARGARHVIAITEGHPLRPEAESLIERVYGATFGAQLDGHFPTLVGIIGERVEIIAAAGYRRADEQSLFLEHYLDAPIQEVLSRACGMQVARTEVAEIGNLAANGAGCSPELFTALAAHLRAEGVVFAAATATRRLRRAFAAFGFEAREIAAAKQSRLAQGGRSWGRYFDHDPVVVWGRVTSGLRRNTERTVRL